MGCGESGESFLQGHWVVPRSSALLFPAHWVWWGSALPQGRQAVLELRILHHSESQQVASLAESWLHQALLHALLDPLAVAGMGSGPPWWQAQVQGPSGWGPLVLV